MSILYLILSYCVDVPYLNDIIRYVRYRDIPDFRRALERFVVVVVFLVLNEFLTSRELDYDY